MAGKSERILVVDDEPMTLDMLDRHLRYSGYEVDLASGATEARSILARLETQIVLSDIQMPGTNGIQLLSQVRTDYPFVRVIMMTGYIRISNLLQCLSLGADGCLTKPIDLDRLVLMIERCRATARDWRRGFTELHALSPTAAMRPSATEPAVAGKDLHSQFVD